MDGLGLGSGVEGIGLSWKSIKRAVRKTAAVAVAPVVVANRAVVRHVPGGKALDRTVRRAGRAVVRKAAQYASPVLAVAAGAAAAAGCTAVGIPGPICALPAAKLGAKAGAALSKRIGVKVSQLPGGIDPVGVVRGDPAALVALGGSLAARAGVRLTPREAIFIAARKAGLPAEVTASARFLARTQGVTA
jgi:hypothetical protein